MQLLERDRQKRPPSAHEVASRLEQMAAVLADDASGVVTSAAERSPAIVTPVTRTPATTGGMREHVLAVMPFEHRGAAADKDVSVQVRDELVDLLARTRGLRALAKSSVTSTLDAKTLGATQMVEASVQTGSGKLRANVRLLDVSTGVQTWAERIEGDYSDPFAGPERAAQRIVEALRLALESVGASSRVPPEAIEHFVQARKRIRTLGFHDPTIVVDLLEKSIELAPGYAPALALHPIACIRSWFSPATAQSREWPAIVKSSITRALDRAAHVAESHHAAGMLAWHEGRLRDAASAARKALSIAPTYPDAMAFLGQLETEAGREHEGLEHVRIAYELEPTLRIGVFEPARWNALYGDLAEAERLLVKIEKELREEVVAGQTFIRAGAWHQKPDWIRRGLALMSRSNAPIVAPLTAYGRVALKEQGAEFVMPDPSFFTKTSPRFASVALQILAEGAMLAERPDEAMAAITQATGLVLADLTWIDRCPLFEPLRERPEFKAARTIVAARVEDIWL
jgi:eukaryotic-like serine/threonine-protein kinase